MGLKKYLPHFLHLGQRYLLAEFLRLVNVLSLKLSVKLCVHPGNTQGVVVLPEDN